MIAVFDLPKNSQQFPNNKLIGAQISNLNAINKHLNVYRVDQHTQKELDSCLAVLKLGPSNFLVEIVKLENKLY